jgi:hypothetical protein
MIFIEVKGWLGVIIEPDNSQLLDYACVITGRLASRQTFV